MILVLILYMVMASTFTLGKAALSYAQPLFLIGTRMLVGGFLLLGYLAWFKREQLIIRRRDSKLFAAIILFHIYGAYVSEFWALQYVTSFKACLLYNLSPFITALLLYLYYGESMSWRKWLGLLIGFVGMLPILIVSEPLETIVGTFGIISIPEAAMLFSVVSAALGWLVMRTCIREARYSPIVVNSVGMIGGGALALITSLIVEGVPHIATRGTGGELGNLLGSDVAAFALYTLLLIIAGNIIAYNLYGFLLRRYSPTFLSFAGFTCPLFAALYGRIFLQETPSVWFFLSVFLVGCGLYIFYQQELDEQSLNA